MDIVTIFITDISIDCIIGVSEQERNKKQTVLISIELIVDAEKASKTDNIKDAFVDYKKVYDTTIKIVSESKFYLLEKLASILLDTYLNMPGVLKAKVTVKKPGRLLRAKGVAVTAEGERI